MINYDEKEHKISYKNNVYNSHDDVDMQVLINEINKTLKLQKNTQCRTSISISDILDETEGDISKFFDVLKLPIFCVTMAGDEYGFNILSVGKHGVFLIQNDYFRAGI